MNGLAALLAPRAMAGTGGVAEASRPTIYVLRLFGVRTVALGAELFVARGDRLERALRWGVAIHLTYAAAAAIGGLRGDIPVRGATVAAVISAANAGLAAMARGR
ncbi:MAG: hypothetical protein ACRDJ4_01440 [Actinomycetota bacterium]